MKVKCIKSSKRKSLIKDQIYRVFGTLQASACEPWDQDEIYFVIFNDDQKKWRAYPSSLFMPTGEEENK